jgi:hypothetical protein
MSTTLQYDSEASRLIEATYTTLTWSSSAASCARRSR